MGVFKLKGDRCVNRTFVSQKKKGDRNERK